MNKDQVGSGCVTEIEKYLIALAHSCFPPTPSIRLLGTLALVSAHVQTLLGSISTHQRESV